MLHTGPQSEHGGHTNAYTAAEDTNYHFDCNTDALDEAVDRFAQVAPVQPLTFRLCLSCMDKPSCVQAASSSADRRSGNGP